MMPRIVITSFFLLFAGTVFAAEPAAVDVEKQRQVFLAALDALRAGNDARYQALDRQLDGYVLHGYVQYEYLKEHLPQTRAPVIRKFLDENAHTPLAEWLRERWLRVLAERGDWKTFIKEYADVPGDTELLCWQLTQRLKSGEQTATVMGRIERLWTTGKRLSPACEPIFAAWKKAGYMTSDKVWERARLAMAAGNVSVAAELASYLPPKERVWLDRWQSMHRDPVRGLENIDYFVETPVARMVVTHGVVRLAYRDEDEAMRQWQRLKAKYQFFGEDDDYVLRYIALLAAQRHSPSALQWLSAVSVRPDDAALQQWRVYSALRAGEWDTVRRFIAALPEEVQHESRWRYWTARATEQKGDKQQSSEMYLALAGERDYYGFLAADRAEAPYAMQHVAANPTPEEVTPLLSRASIKAAKELYTLGQIVDARRQWNFAIRDFNKRQLEVAAVIAREWGWHDRAIQAAVLSGQTNDLDLRFPLLYRSIIEANANEYGVDAGWIYGVVRQESAFVVDARSPAGALGLMQLMPATGRATLQRLKLGGSVPDALLNVEQNLRLGIGYLKQVLERYQGHQLLATAAYNAGPNRVDSWMPTASVDADIWVETIPYNETRGYVKNVLAYAVVYDHRLGRHPTRLTTRMPTIAAGRAGSS
ncbi:MAG: transglycosylase SLT domain-containing protein [Gammaproteobacteria bacterium]|nr:transglycosylase SLT domain-containing protein [Gammaproteobacteria bacterium]